MSSEEKGTEKLNRNIKILEKLHFRNILIRVFYSTHLGKKIVFVFVVLTIES